MPCGGGDIGLNVWVENGDLLIYLSKSGTFDENNTFLKLGRIRVKLSPNPFSGADFKQELVLNDGYVNISGSGTRVKVWVDVFNPLVHVDISSATPTKTEVAYETWRDHDRPVTGKENNQNSYKFAAKGHNVTTLKDSVTFQQNGVSFYHRNRDSTIFDVTVKQQGLDSVKNRLYNPLKNLTFGGLLYGPNLQAAGTYKGTYLNTGFTGYKLQSKEPSTLQNITVALYADTSQTLDAWKGTLQHIVIKAHQTEPSAITNTINWWHKYWARAYINIQPGKPNTPEWQAGRNYQLFRYMLGCNAYGTSPTKFNGGLFTYDPALVDSTYKFTPDFRNWGGGLMTAQNQRLVYFPMLKNGDWELLRPQLDFYLRALPNAELRTRVYWNHNGASFTEQLENFGLPNFAEYGNKRPAGYDNGMEYNNWLEYEWDTVFQFCLLMLEEGRYSGKNVSGYIPFIQSCLSFYSDHYQYLAKQSGKPAFDGNGHLIIAPGSAAETYKLTVNSTTTIAAMQSILTRLLALPLSYSTEQQRKDWRVRLSQIPPISFREFAGHKTIAPAQSYQRINNTEEPQLYPVFPWHLYGIGKPDLQTAINTFQYDTDALKFRSYMGWKQDNIFAADLGLTQQAAELTLQKLKDSGRRFPAFWGPGFDWAPDHNWGGTGMIGLQEMLLQGDDKKIYIFAAWPKTWDVSFKLHAPYNTTVEAVLKNGKITRLKVTPQSRLKDVVNMLK